MTAYHWVYDQVTCGLTAKKLGSAQCPVLVIEYGTPLYTYDMYTTMIVWLKLYRSQQLLIIVHDCHWLMRLMSIIQQTPSGRRTHLFLRCAFQNNNKKRL